MCISTFVSQLILVGVFGLKKYPAGTVLLAPLILLTPLFYWAILRSYKAKSNLLPRAYVVTVDAIMNQRLTEQEAQNKSLTAPETPKDNHYANEAESEKADTTSTQLMPRRPLNIRSSESNISQSYLNSPHASNLQRLGVHSDLLTTNPQAFSMPIYRQLEFAVDTRVPPPVSAEGLSARNVSFVSMYQAPATQRSQTWSDVERGMGAITEAKLGHIRVDSPKNF